MVTQCPINMFSPIPLNNSITRRGWLELLFPETQMRPEAEVKGTKDYLGPEHIVIDSEGV